MLQRRGGCLKIIKICVQFPFVSVPINLFGHIANLNAHSRGRTHPWGHLHAPSFLCSCSVFWFLCPPSLPPPSSFVFCFCYVFFCFLAKLRLALHGASSSTHSRALVDKKLQICVRKARSLQDRMQHPQPAQPPPTCHPPQGGRMTQSTR